MKIISRTVLSTALKIVVFVSLSVGGRAAASEQLSELLKTPLSRTESRTESRSRTLSQRPNPNQDRLLPSGTELPNALPEPPEVDPAEDTESPIDSEAPPASIDNPLPIENSTDSPVEFSIERIEVVGSTVLSAEDLTEITEPFAGTTVTLADLTQVAESITQLYLQRGYITSRARLPEQALTDGVVTIQVSEGSLSEIQVEGLSRLNDRYLSSRIERAVTTPFNANTLEEQLRLLGFDPLLESVQGRLQPGERPGESILNIEAEEAGAWRIGASVDNYGSPRTGSERLGTSVAYQNLFGWGDTLSTSYTRSTTGGSNVWDIGYRLPVNSLDGALSLRASFDNFKITAAGLEGLADGSSDRYELSFRQPLIRTLREELALSAGFSYRDGKTFQVFSGSDPIDSRTSIFKFGQDYTRRDTQGVWALRSQFSLGTGLFDATDKAGDAVDGQFFSWLGQVQRVQRLSQDNLLIIQGDLQLTPDGLLPIEQFLIGGGQSLRGYRQNARIGDNGFRVSIEDRITIDRDDTEGTPVVQLAPFLDMGAVWNSSSNPNSLGDQNFLAGAGLGFIYNPLDSFSARLDYALPLITLDDEGDNAQDEGFYFSLNYQY